MIRKHAFTLLIIFALGSFTSSRAQEIDSIIDKSQEILEKGRVFSIKGIGMAFPMGDVSDVLRPRFSTEIGLQILLKNPRYFVYPALNYLNYKYDQRLPDTDYEYLTRNASAKLYVASVSGGYIKYVKRFRVFASAGLGAGIVNEPRSTVNTQLAEVRHEMESSATGALRLNTGVDYGKRAFKLFAEVSYMHYTRKIQGYNMQTLAFTVGTRTNLSRLARTLDSIKKK